MVGGHATVCRLSNNVFLDVSSNSENFWKWSLDGHATVVGGHATVGWLSSTFSVFVTQPTEYCTSMRVIALLSRLNIILTLLCIRIYNRSIVGQSSESHVTVAWPSRTYIHIYVNEREREREREREERVSPSRSIRTPPCCAVGRFISRLLREREITFQDHVMYDKMRIALCIQTQSCYVYYMGNCIYATSPMFIMGNLFPS